MKKTTALSFLMLANAILLAHATIPHHHEMEVCSLDSQKCCTIDNVYTFTDSIIKAACHKHTKCDCGKAFYTLILSTLNTHDFVNDIRIHFRQNPYVPLFYSKFISQSIGLRAPPLLNKGNF